MAKTILSTYGTDATNELAAIAIDLLCAPPAREPARTAAGNLLTGRAKVPWQLVLEGRQIMERHGIHWRALKSDNERSAA